MALIARADQRIFLSEENSLKGGTQGWMAEGDDVFIRCARPECGKITRVYSVKPDFRDGRGTCVTCKFCRSIFVYIFAGWKSDKPRFKDTGTYQIVAAYSGEENVFRLNREGCSCGGTMMSMTQGCPCPACREKKISAYSHCLSCLKRVPKEP